MIRNRLSILLAERGLTITKVAKETGISRNTITSTAQNDTEMIRLETINSLCKFLNVTPTEFFEYEPIDIEFEATINKLEYSSEPEKPNFELTDIKIDLLMDVTGDSSLDTIDLNCSLTNKITLNTMDDFLNLSTMPIHLNVEFNKEQEKELFINRVYNNIQTSFHRDIHSKLEKAIYYELSNRFNDLFLEFISLYRKYFDFNPTPDLEAFTLNQAKYIKIEINSDVFKPF